MANLNQPFGFQEQGVLEGMLPNSGLTPAVIVYNYGTSIFRGDPVSNASGYVNQAAAGVTQIWGVFNGCEYYSATMKQPFWSPYWPASGGGSTMSGNAKLITNPNATFLVQTGNSNTTASPAAQADVGKTANFAIGTGNTANGISGAYLDLYQAGDVTTQPFKIIALASTFLAPGSPGADDTTAYNWVLVGFNFQVFRSLNGH